jgi:outer membrane lipoprotein-sorting protein
VSALLRRLSLSRLLLLCGVAIAVGIGATALALAIGTGPVPAPKPLDEAVHDALTAPHVEGVSARIELTDDLLEGANLASGGGGEASQLSSSPLISGASGRLWIGDGRARLELQSEKGDTQILWNGKTAELYDASTNTLYRYTPEQTSGQSPAAGSSDSSSTSDRQPPSIAQVHEGIEHLEKHAVVSAAQPTDVAGQPAYTVRVSPREGGSLLGGAELSWDAVHGVPLRFAVYSTESSSPVIELAASEISYGPVESSALDFTPPENAKIEEIEQPTAPSSSGASSARDESEPHVSTHGTGLSSIVLLEKPVKPSSDSPLPSQLQELPKVDIGGTSATELQTELGTVLSFERSGVRYLMAGSVTPSAIEAFARGL